MKKIEIFNANDGTLFKCGNKCAEYEIEKDPSIVERIEKKLEKVPGSHQINWCTPSISGCCCMGCVNHHIHELGLEKEHWNVWMEKYRQPRVDDERDSGAVFELFLNFEKNPKNTELIKCLKKVQSQLYMSMTAMEINTLINNAREGNPLYEYPIYSNLVDMKNAIEADIDIVCEIKKNPTKKNTFRM